MSRILPSAKRAVADVSNHDDNYDHTTSPLRVARLVSTADTVPLQRCLLEHLTAGPVVNVEPFNLHTGYSHQDRQRRGRHLGS